VLGCRTFLGVSLLVIVTPGPDTAVTVRNTLIGHRRGGCFTALGVAAGQTVWALGTPLGLVALLVASETVFEAVRWLGAALVGLGLRLASEQR
jgi:threonine/homoserine/homoserine lactone efflux protein